ncbi:hypothetical protein CB1_000978022 [Camelus ferus]|nr:hypothetical protein CB1_000978022 [Camelus ferus]
MHKTPSLPSGEQCDQAVSQWQKLAEVPVSTVAGHRESPETWDADLNSSACGEAVRRQREAGVHDGLLPICLSFKTGFKWYLNLFCFQKLEMTSFFRTRKSRTRGPTVMGPQLLWGPAQAGKAPGLQVPLTNRIQDATLGPPGPRL